jgi:adenylosuccinate synthase
MPATIVVGTMGRRGQGGYRLVSRKTDSVARFGGDNRSHRHRCGRAVRTTPGPVGHPLSWQAMLDGWGMVINPASLLAEWTTWRRVGWMCS